MQIVSDDGVSALAEISAIDSEKVTVRCLEKLAESHEPFSVKSDFSTRIS